jgi:hypothetical protein
VSKVGGDAKIVPVGILLIDGYKVFCSTRPTRVLDRKLDDFGAAYQGFLILNPKLLARISGHAGRRLERGVHSYDGT